MDLVPSTLFHDVCQLPKQQITSFRSSVGGVFIQNHSNVFVIDSKDGQHTALFKSDQGDVVYRWEKS